ncbi:MULTISPECIES: DUF262 domain-containing HNH endonuclease family protein [unclassified Microcoleus]|uniref:DUF262 domain-containing protein n=1 Tax=unclassified Microcoleus TaxID=2642155 RepID=UPI001DBC89E7|nr:MULTISPECIES: DUF262 domain-containing HNH endonuclease family protein [unclassified Microcoleus]MCC3504604.1 DUF262 domain-containing protein [Microcoleus sp. PH2017_19_SFW_U_A]TAG85061.1 MAG: DUF262 domain-containing protein [Oscillatoriales cyanobacterium]MCC3452022.1 DUF262 domain-containing protein [Microcoleus sp. PH2017_08_TRC_O_A]MCC3522068.1 DUF262 domain-containing protein [Microcoleus sp. PH2017_20_SFW_D_A]MCC3553067.1 DUF262 domain-containing protein [Microcoleus sp. PH2017_35_S
MATAPRIESHNLSIADLFKEFYAVPDFQREYVWADENVEKLLVDIIDELYDNDEPLEDSEYFLGSLVVYPDNGTFQLIDGQQRLTTIYLLFCAIRDFVIIESGKTSKAIEGLIAGVDQDTKTGLDIDRYRLTLQYGDGGKVLEIIADSKSNISNIDKTASESATKLVEAYETIREFLLSRFGSSVEKRLQFSGTFTSRVKLIRIGTLNLKSALKVFETINHRGVGLNSMDLLKNYLFINTSKQESKDLKLHWKELKKRWDKMINTIHDSKEDPMRFLRYYIMSHYAVNLQNNFPEEAVYDWFTKEGSRYKIDKFPLKFVDTLIKASEDFSNFTKCKNVDGSDNQFLKNIKKLQGRYSQHFILLLAARELPKDLFTELCYHIENLLFTYTITRSTRKDINMIRDFSQWSQDLLQVKNREQFEAFIEFYFIDKFVSLSNEFNSAFRELTESKIATYRIRYVLAKITQFVDNQAYSNASQLDRYLDKSITIEHILPKSVNPELRSKFDKPNEYGSYVEKLGNLVLLEKTINSSLSDSTYDAKKSGYKQSQLLLPRSLVEKPGVGNNTQLNRTVNHLNLTQFDVWDSKAIDKRQEMLVNLARLVWGFETQNK